jgi:hypothetical protein
MEIQYSEQSDWEHNIAPYLNWFILQAAMRLAREGWMEK